MTTTLSSKGQVVLPRWARARLRLVAGTKLDCEVKGDSIVLRPQSSKLKLRETVTDEITGLLVTKRTQESPTVTSEMVKALMADFP